MTDTPSFDELEARRTRLSQLMVLILPGFGRWIAQLRDFETPYGKAGIRQLDVLYSLRHELLDTPTPTATELARYFRVQRSVITRILAKLEAGGFVTREVDSTDLRASRATITERGRLLSDFVQQQIFNDMRAALGDLDQQDVVAMERAMEILLRVESSLHETPTNQLVDRLFPSPRPASADPDDAPEHR